jgi:hypothetical protein
LKKSIVHAIGNEAVIFRIYRRKNQAIRQIQPQLREMKIIGEKLELFRTKSQNIVITLHPVLTGF